MEDKEYGATAQESVHDHHGGATNGAAAQKRGGVMNTLYPPGPKPGAGPRMKNHCRKFWWCDLIVIIAIILVVVLPVIFVAIPHKAQNDINASTLEVTSQEVTDTQPDKIHVKIKSTARSGSSFHPTIEAFKAGLSTEGQEPFLYLNIPEVKAEAETPIDFDHDAEIINMDSFKEYNKVAIASEKFTISLKGKTKVHQKGLSAISVDYDKKVEMKGLNHLSGMKIEDIKILAGNKTLPDGSNMVGNVIYNNPSIMTLDLGNVTMNLGLDGKNVGYAFLPELVLRPGANNLTMTSKIEALQIYSEIMKKYTSGVIPLEVVGNSSVRNGQHLEYFEAAIKSNTINIDLDVGPALAGIGLNIKKSSN